MGHGAHNPSHSTDSIFNQGLEDANIILLSIIQEDVFMCIIQEDVFTFSNWITKISQHIALKSYLFPVFV